MRAELAPIALEYTMPPGAVRAGTRLHNLVEAVQGRREAIEGTQGACEDYLWRTRWARRRWRGHRRIWELHTLEGLRISEIARAVGRSRPYVRKVLRYHQRRARGG